ncbi:MAG: GNAT family N-acetyltransferase [Acidimicrobiales bacterium]
MTDDRLSVRPMCLDEVHIRIAYFHNASDDYLNTLGVDRTLLLALRERETYGLLWEHDGQPAGFSTLDRIRFGEEAFMHLHILESSNRRIGFGTHFVRLSLRHYLEVLKLHHLYCEPNAFNTAPNRTVQRAGFRYLFSHEATPSPIDFPQATTRWVFERDWLPQVPTLG